MSGHFAVEDRDLSQQERAILVALLEATEAGRERLGQSVALRVVGRCTCGCRTIALSAAGIPRPGGASRVVASAPATSPEGVPLDLLVHVRDGEIAELEIYAQDASENFSLPAIDELELWNAV